jgi:hypothetical protein
MSTAARAGRRLWVLGSFATPEALLDAAGKLRDRDLGELDVYSAYPLHGAEEVLRTPRSKVPLIVLIAGLSGAVGGFVLQWWAQVVAYPINFGGRPMFSWPAFIPVTFELGVLCASTAAFFGLFALLGLPRPHHPVFEVEAFRSAQIDRYWVSVCSAKLDARETITAALGEVGAADISVVDDEGDA